ncbi:hypothetical protein HYS30_00070, partial [Candidatus Peregrinibacteria bacterium]|nr:hypothetical protein [Candidatus Peregrinibacteria bacterium]
MIRSVLLLIALLHCSGNVALAQGTEHGDPLRAETSYPKAVITGPKDIPLGRTSSLDASKSSAEGEMGEDRWYGGR